MFSVFASFYIYDRKLENVDITFIVLLINAHKAKPNLKICLEVSQAKYLLTPHRRVENFCCCFRNKGLAKRKTSKQQTEFFNSFILHTPFIFLQKFLVAHSHRWSVCYHITFSSSNIVLIFKCKARRIHLKDFQEHKSCLLFQIRNNLYQEKRKTDACFSLS